MQISREGDMNRNNTPLCGGRKEHRLTKLLPKSVQCINEDLKKVREEMESPEEFGSRAASRFTHDRCEHAATPYYAQCNQMPRSTMEEMEEEKIPKRGTLVIFCKSMNLKLKSLEIILLSKSFARSRWRGANCITLIYFLYLPLMDPQFS